MGPFEYYSTGLYLCLQTGQIASSNIHLFSVKVRSAFCFFPSYSISAGIRLSTFGFVVLATIYQSESNDFATYQILIGFLAAPISNCFNTLIAVSVFFVFAISSTSLLFFLRARAVFLSNPLATAFFGVLWLGVLGGSLTSIPGIRGANLGPTRYCTIGMIRFYSVAAAITPLINDSIIFFAISWRLCANIAPPTLRNDVKTMVFGDHLPAFSKSLLQDGQVYFLSVFYNLFYERQLITFSTGPLSVQIL